MEEQVSLVHKGLTLRGILHIPDDEDTNPAPAVAIYHGFTGTKVEPHRLFVKMARALANVGIIAVRFDFSGSGDSDGDFIDMTISGEIEEAVHILRFLAEMPQADSDRLGVLGLSMGGCVAACVAGRASEVKSAALWSATALLPPTLRERCGPEGLALVQAQGYLDRAGNLLGLPLLDDWERVKPLEEIARFAGPALVVQGVCDQTVNPENALAYQRAIRGECKLVMVDGADHTFNCFEWESQVIAETTDWFMRTL